MTLAVVETWVRWVGFAALVLLFTQAVWRIANALHRPRGRSTGAASTLIRAPFLLIAGMGWFFVTIILWRPLPLDLSLGMKILALLLGVAMFFPGVCLYFWGAVTLGEMFNASSPFGVQLDEDHVLVTSGPFANLRHPLYLGLMLTAFGGCLIYRTWTYVFVSCCALGLLFRARTEELALSDEFGEQWEVYCQHVPAWFPRFRREKGGIN
jgi:protein-S-isoprenylcysteine O-methyltransferase Ste14